MIDALSQARFVPYSHVWWSDAGRSLAARLRFVIAKAFQILEGQKWLKHPRHGEREGKFFASLFASEWMRSAADKPPPGTEDAFALLYELVGVASSVDKDRGAVLELLVGEIPAGKCDTFSKACEIVKADGVPL